VRPLPSRYKNVVREWIPVGLSGVGGGNNDEKVDPRPRGVGPEIMTAQTFCMPPTSSSLARQRLRHDQS
jgi:hypothetical protein